MPTIMANETIRTDARRTRLFDARRVGAARGHLARLAAQPDRLARQARHHPLGLRRDRAQDRAGRDRPHAGRLRGRGEAGPPLSGARRAPIRRGSSSSCIPTNRGWTRDSGPIFVRRRRREAETAIVHFHFNAWAKYPDWQKDRRVPEIAAKRLGKRLFHAAVRRARFRPRRRRHRRQRPRHAADHRGVLPRPEDAGAQSRAWAASEFEAALKEYLGVTNVFWLGGGVGGRRHARARRRHLPVRESEDRGADQGRQSRATSTTGRWRRTGSGSGPAAGGRLEARGRAAADARAALLRRRPAAGQLRQLLHLQRGGDRADLQRSERPRRAGHPGRAVPGPPGGRHPRRGPGAAASARCTA